jgi:gag-polypeptide of LTR copia-type
LAPILAQVLNAETSQQLWQQLQQSHTSQSVAKILELKLTLQTSKKGSSCAQFLQHIQSIVDKLRSVGSAISDQDMMLYTLQGLNLEYESFITVFSMQQSNTSMIELQSLLLAHEARVLATLTIQFDSSCSPHLLSIYSV